MKKKIFLSIILSFSVISCVGQITNNINTNVDAKINASANLNTNIDTKINASANVNANESYYNLTPASSKPTQPSSQLYDSHNERDINQPSTEDEFWKLMEKFGFMKSRTKEQLLADIRADVTREITAWSPGAVKDVDKNILARYKDADTKKYMNPYPETVEEYIQKSFDLARKPLTDVDFYVDVEYGAKDGKGRINTQRVNNKTLEVLYYNDSGLITNYTQTYFPKDGRFPPLLRVTHFMFVPPSIFKGVSATPSSIIPSNPVVTNNPIPTPTPSPTLIPIITREKTVFSSNRDGNWEIYEMNFDTSNQNRLTNNSFTDINPIWSPDGNRIAFTSDRNGTKQIYIMNSDGSNLLRLTDNKFNDDKASFSPDGTKIAFTSTRDGNQEIYVMNSDGSNQTRLTVNTSDDYRPTWSPDGTKIVYDSSISNTQEIYVMDSNGSNQVRLTNTSEINISPIFSPDGTKIAFQSNRDGNYEIYLMNSDGTNRINISNNSSLDEAPSWTKDGNNLLFVSKRDGSHQIYIMKSDGTNQVRLINNIFDDRSPRHFIK